MPYFAPSLLLVDLPETTDPGAPAAEVLRLYTLKDGGGADHPQLAVQDENGTVIPLATFSGFLGGVANPTTYTATGSGASTLNADTAAPTLTLLTDVLTWITGTLVPALNNNRQTTRQIISDLKAAKLVQ